MPFIREGSGSTIYKCKGTAQRPPPLGGGWEGVLLDYKARFYDSSIGRFIQPDTIIPNPGDPQSWNRYSYVFNRPTLLVDPTGHFGKLNDEKSDYWNRTNQEKVRLLERQWERERQARTSLGGGKPVFSMLSGGTPPPTPTACPQAALACLPTATATPTPYAGPIMTAPSPPSPHLSVSLYVDWKKVDLLDAGIDGVGLLANVVAIGAGALGSPQVALGAEIVGGVVEGVGLVKSGYELVRGDPRDLMLQQTTNQAERVALMVARTERLAPFVGFAGNLVSLGINLKPQVSVQWVVP